MKRQTQNLAIIPLLFRVSSRGGLTVLTAALIFCFTASAVAQSLVNPVRIARAPDGNILVSDFTLQAIVEFDRLSLEAVDAVVLKQRVLAIGQAGNRMYVGNATAGCVEVYDVVSKNKPKFLYKLGDKRSGTNVVQRPADLAIDEGRGLVFVLDGTEKVVKVFSVEGPLLYTIPGGGPDPNLLANPTAIAIDTVNQEVLVSDYGDPLVGFPPARIQIFSYTGDPPGDHLAQLSGDRGFTGLNFSRPQGLGVHAGKIYMVDSVLGQIMVYDRATLTDVGTIGKFGTNPGELFAPTDLVIDAAAGDIYVTSSKPARVEAFRGGLLP